MQAIRTLRKLRFAALFAAAVSIGSASGSAATQSNEQPPPANQEANLGDIPVATTLEPYYAEVLASWLTQGLTTTTAQPIRLKGASSSAQSADRYALSGTYREKDDVLLWQSAATSWVEYTFTVKEDALYTMKLDYHSLDRDGAASDTRTPVMLAVTVDGAFPYREARAIPFRRMFKDELPPKTDRSGNDIRPKPQERKEWIEEPFRDAANAYSEPLLWHFTKGAHTIRLAGDQPVAIASLTVAPQEPILPYADYAASLPADTNLPKETITVEAEAMAAKNDVSILIAVDRDARSVPSALRKDRFNTVGGAQWGSGGQSISWTFRVPSAGRYRIAMRALQNTASNLSAFRTIAIDGKVPFRELLAYRFPYSASWQGLQLRDDKRKPYEFSLTEGEHTLTMTATSAPYQPVIIRGERAAGAVREIVVELKALTGNVVDKDRTWKIERDLPELPGRLRAIREELQQMAQLLLATNGRRDNLLQLIETSVKDLDSYLKVPNEIPYYTDQLSAMQEKLGTVRESLLRSALQLDQLYIVPLESPIPKMEAAWYERLRASAVRFLNTFSREDKLEHQEEDVLNVWVNRGRDYVNLLQELSDELFTPETGIPVRVSLLPDENLLLYANAAGMAPDIALGQPQDKSIDFAMRNALLDLSQFPDFRETASRFAPGALLPFYYNKGYYALPETQSFKVLFYRKDIMQQLGLRIPDTWEDVYAMMPTLQQNGYNFYVPPNDYVTFMYQNGAEFFDRGGLRTALDSPAAFQGFKQLTDLFNLYDLEKSVPSFYQHFRKGTMPIGVADYNLYVTLSVAAPELTGWWGIAPLPGVKQPDGTVARWSSGGQTAAFIYKSSARKEQAWAFLKWLVSAETQERYGSDLESYYGVGFRWNTANIEAFTHLWPKQELAVILEQWRWYKELPNLPGSYFIPRELGNAWNRSVLKGVHFRDSLEEAVVNINREMSRKSREFGFLADDGRILHTLEWPVVDQPWEGVDPYVAK